MNIFGGRAADIRATAISELLKEFHVLAKKSCYNTITPPALRGKSGVVHSFSLLLASKGKFVGVDIYENVGEVEVLKTYIKRLDTGASAYIVSANTSPIPQTRVLSDAYGVKIFTRDELYEMLETKSDPSVSAVSLSPDPQCPWKSPEPEGVQIASSPHPLDCTTR